MGVFDNTDIPAPLLQVQADEVPCPMAPDMCENPDPVEPEVDGSHQYYECPECGYAWGYQRVDEGTRLEGNCQLGIPESVRRSASSPMERAIEREASRQPVELGLSIGRRPE